MPKIPMYESREQLTIQPGVMRKDVAAAGMPGRMIAEAGKAISEVVGLFEKARDIRQLTEAETEASKKFLTIKEEASMDNDPDNYQKYAEQLQKIKQNAGKNIINANVRNQFVGKIELTGLSVDADLRSIFRKKQIDFGAAALIEGIDAKKQLYLTAGLDAQRKLYKKEAFTLIDQARDAQYITAKAAVKEKQAIDKDWIAAQVEIDIATDPVIAKSLLTTGGYPDLTRDARVDYLEIADKAIKRKEKEDKQAHEDKWLKNGTQVGIDVATGKMSATELLEEIRNDNIDPDYGYDLYNWKTEPGTVEYETDKKIWVEMARTAVDPMKDLAEIQRAISKAMNAKQISADDGANFMVALQGLYEKADQFKNSPKRAYLKAALESIKYIADALPKNMAIPFGYVVGKELLRRVIQENIPADKILDIADEIIKEETVKSFPNIRNFDQKGQLCVDQYGAKAIVYPDGRIEEVK